MRLVLGLLGVTMAAVVTPVVITVSTPVTELSAATAHAAAPSHVTLSGPKKRRVGKRVTLKGTAEGTRSVLVQQRKAGRWVTVRRPAVRRNHRFVARVRPAVGRAKFRAVTPRAVTPRATSARHVVKVRRAPVRPPTAPEAEPPAEPAEPPVSTDACGTQPRKADGSLWSCTFNDDFNGTTLDRSRWVPQTVFTSGDADAYACYYDDPDNIAVADGELRLTVREVAEPRPCAPSTKREPTVYTSGMVSTYRQFSQQYGRFEARFKVEATNEPGLQEAFWLWPDDRVVDTTQWPASGEIDIVETYSQYWWLAVPYLHYTANDNGGPIPGVNTAWDCQAQRGVFNTYALEWTADRLTILVNGKTCLVNTSGDPAFRAPYIMALTQSLGQGANGYDGRAPLPATMSVDYVRVWE